MFYRGVEVGLHRLDLLSADKIVVELKAAKGITDTHFVFVRSYLRAVGRDHGLILNFAKPTLEIKRVRTRTFDLSDSFSWVPGFLSGFLLIAESSAASIYL